MKYLRASKVILNIIRKITVAFFLVFLLSAELAYPYTKAKATKDKVNIRSDSTIMSISLGWLKKGTVVKVIGQNYEWYKVLVPRDISCYVSADFVRKIADNKLEVMASELSLRSAPSKEAEIVGRVSKGRILFLREELKNGWVRVRGHPYMYGWVNKALMLIEK
jgi:uncharacterized protein YgiM (DUF1202 family)